VTTTQDPKDTLDALENKLNVAREHLSQAQEAINECAFEAHTGNANARKALDKRKADVVLWTQEIVSLEVAVAEARRRAAAADKTAADEAEADRARQALEMVDTLAAHGKALDEALEGLKARYAAFAADYQRLGQLGYSAPSWALVATNCRTALLTGLMGGDLQIDHLAPGARKTYRAVVEGWAANVRSRATARLTRNKDAATAA
jgi:hypothetical protein